jgi:hypothetical protein
MIRNRRQRRNEFPAPPPEVRHVGGHDFTVRSHRSGATYTATAERDGTVMCGCPARVECYHLPYIKAAAAEVYGAFPARDSIAEMLEEIKTLCGDEYMSPFDKDREIWTLAKRIEIARREERGERRIA